jgi:hypothetical protein
MRLKTFLVLTILFLSVSFFNVSANGIDEIKAEREIYLENNISYIVKEKGLTPKKEFKVKSMDWISRDSVLVEFKDKKKTYLALIDFKEDSNAVEYVQIFEPGE